MSRWAKGQRVLLDVGPPGNPKWVGGEIVETGDGYSEPPRGRVDGCVEVWRFNPWSIRDVTATGGEGG